MSKAKSKSVKGAGGPWLNGAFICDRSMEERDGVISAIRIVDVVRIEPVPDPLPKGFVLGTSLHFVVMFKSGDFKGTLDYHLDWVGPSGQRAKMFEVPLEFKGNDAGGHNIRMQMHIKWDGQGLYWFDVHLGKKLVTRVPLRIEVGKTLSGGTTSAS